MIFSTGRPSTGRCLHSSSDAPLKCSMRGAARRSSRRDSVLEIRCARMVIAGLWVFTCDDDAVSLVLARFHGLKDYDVAKRDISPLSRYTKGVNERVGGRRMGNGLYRDDDDDGGDWDEERTCSWCVVLRASHLSSYQLTSTLQLYTSFDGIILLPSSSFDRVRPHSTSPQSSNNLSNFTSRHDASSPGRRMREEV